MKKWLGDMTIPEVVSVTRFTSILRLCTRIFAPDRRGLVSRLPSRLVGTALSNLQTCGRGGAR